MPARLFPDLEEWHGLNRHANRLSAIRVKNGVVQKKNNWARTPTYWNTRQELPVIDRQRPGRGYKHLLRAHHIDDFISIVPDWDELSRGLDAILLAPGERNLDGW